MHYNMAIAQAITTLDIDIVQELIESLHGIKIENECDYSYRFYILEPGERCYDFVEICRVIKTLRHIADINDQLSDVRYLADVVFSKTDGECHNNLYGACCASLSNISKIAGLNAKLGKDELLVKAYMLKFFERLHKQLIDERDMKDILGLETIFRNAIGNAADRYGENEKYGVVNLIVKAEEMAELLHSFVTSFIYASLVITESHKMLIDNVRKIVKA